MFLFDFLYILFILISFPYWIKFIFKKEYRQILKNRIFPGFALAAGVKRIWIHAVSVGEVRSLKSLIDKLQNEDQQQIVLSVTTPSGYHYAKKVYKEIEVINAPIDLSFIVRRFYKRINPVIFILNELEIWPNWIFTLNKKQVPIILINGRISQRAFKRYRRFRFFLKPIFNRIDLFLLQSRYFKHSFETLLIRKEKLLISGNIKADEAVQSANSLPDHREICRYLKINPGIHKKIVVIASSHASDEEQLFPVIKKYLPEFSFIMVPRHINRINDIIDKMNTWSIPYFIWSQAEAVDLTRGVLIFDRIGFLFNIQKIADIVFMGGTFEKKIGGHNLYEPAALGKLILGGPFYNNFPEIGEELEKLGTYLKVTHSSDMIKILKNVPALDWKGIERKSQNLISQKVGSLKCTLQEIRKLI